MFCSAPDCRECDIRHLPVWRRLGLHRGDGLEVQHPLGLPGGPCLALVSHLNNKHWLVSRLFIFFTEAKNVLWVPCCPPGHWTQLWKTNLRLQQSYPSVSPQDRQTHLSLDLSTKLTNTPPPLVSYFLFRSRMFLVMRMR